MNTFRPTFSNKRLLWGWKKMGCESRRFIQKFLSERGQRVNPIGAPEEQKCKLLKQQQKIPLFNIY